MTPGCHHTPSVQADSVSLGEAEVAEERGGATGARRLLPVIEVVLHLRLIDAEHAEGGTGDPLWFRIGPATELLGELLGDPTPTRPGAGEVRRLRLLNLGLSDGLGV